MPPKKKRGREEAPTGVDAEGNETFGNKNSSRQDRYTTISFTINCPLDSEIFPFDLVNGSFQQWVTGSERSVTLCDTPYKIATPMTVNDVLIHYAWQWEMGKGKDKLPGRLHIQGCAAFRTRQYLTAIIRLFALLPEIDGKRLHPHIEAVKGPYVSMVEYVTKADGDPRWPGHGGRIPGTECVIWSESNGDDPLSVARQVGQGHRTDIEDIHTQILNGRNYNDLLLDPVYGPSLARNGNWAIAVQGARDRKITEGYNIPREIHVFWGETGTGKTRRVLYETEKKFGDKGAVYIHTLSGKFWDGYAGQKVVLLDEVSCESLRRACIDITMMLRILDRYQVRVEVKGGVSYLVNTMVYITSNEDPELWYPNISEGHRKALVRRLAEGNSTVEHFTAPWEPEGGWG